MSVRFAERLTLAACIFADPQLRQSFAAPLIGDDLTNPGVDRERIALPTTVVDPDVPLVVNRGPNASTAVPAAAPG